MAANEMCKHEELSEFRELAATNASFSAFVLVSLDSKKVYLRSWNVVARKLLDCSRTICRVTLKDFKFDQATMDFFRSVNPDFFASTVVFSSVDFSVDPSCFEELFNKILKPKTLQLTGVRGVTSEMLSTTLCKLVSLGSASVIKLFDLIEPNSSLNLDFDVIFTFLHDSAAVGRKEFAIEVGYFQVRIEEIWDRLCKRFVIDTAKAAYELRIKYPPGLPLPRKCQIMNSITKEVLTLEVYSSVQSHPFGQLAIEGFQLVFSRRSIAVQAACQAVGEV